MRKHSFFGFGPLSQENIHETLLKMSRRSCSGGLLHSVVFLVFFYEHLIDHSPVRLWLSSATLIMGTIFRVFLTRKATFFFKRKHGVTSWRALFTFNSVAMMSAWSYCISLCMIEHGFTAETYLYVATAIAIAGISTSAFAFDLINNILCQLALQLPVIVLPLILNLDMGYFSFSIFKFRHGLFFVFNFCLYVLLHLYML